MPKTADQVNWKIYSPGRLFHFAKKTLMNADVNAGHTYIYRINSNVFDQLAAVKSVVDIVLHPQSLKLYGFYCQNSNDITETIRN